MRDTTGNLPILPGIFPDYAAPIVRNAPDGVRELTTARWGMQSPIFALKGRNSDPGVTNVRNVGSPRRRKRRWRCNGLCRTMRCGSWRGAGNRTASIWPKAAHWRSQSRPASVAARTGRRQFEPDVHNPKIAALAPLLLGTRVTSTHKEFRARFYPFQTNYSVWQKLDRRRR
jgi:hypothetical protein